MHRLVLDEGRVQLSLWLGPLDKTLRELDVPADSIVLTGPTFGSCEPPATDQTTPPTSTRLQTLQALSRLCRQGTRLAWPGPSVGVGDGPSTAEWQQCGFTLTPTGPDITSAQYAPTWTARNRLRQASAPAERRVLVVGAGLSGSAVAHSLARRGWHVTVLDRAQGVGDGASGLPAGLTAPHVSPDDSVLSRITRAGVRATLQRAEPLLQSGTDWALTGVLEHRVEGKRSLPTGEAWPAAGHDWSSPASAEQILAAGLANTSPALWHGLAGWIRPRQLVAAQLQTPGVQVLWGQTVARLRRESASDGTWEALDSDGHCIAQASLVVFAGGYDTLHLLSSLIDEGDKPPVPLNPLRGQISFGLTDALPLALRDHLPPFPVNGHGSFISGVPTPDGQPGWFIGSTFERNCTQAPVRTEDHAANQQRLTTLLPGLGEAMAPQFAPARVQGWAGLRCTLPDRLPAVGPVNPSRWPGVWMSAGMGARGISLAVLCGELAAAWLGNEPLPLAPSLAKHLAASRFQK
ncbi:MAG: FAD-dependent 5-carboxymethylaminomethyl-2-thiouridine(34) oxidoreductase MnmC [Limnohabitans sp.]|nr:FAD-dependent 5-carboxymethylaminomethyl-2-thiouridine(34) oxidoreductase MnmC [Limnohabitans sp.]